MQVTLDTHIRIPLTELPTHIRWQIEGALTIANPAYEKAIREKLWTGNMPKTLELYREEGPDLILPRGFYAQLIRGLSAYQQPAQWVDNRRDYQFQPLGRPIDPIKLSDYQREPVNALITYEQGNIEGVTGAGKTVIALEAIRRVDQPTLIIVDRGALAAQWSEQIVERFDITPGYVGEDKLDVRPITIALRQAIWARFEDFEQEIWELPGLVGTFFDLWSVLVLDEVHHVPADTLSDIVQNFPARYRWGFSATPARDPELFPITTAVVGPVLATVTEEDAAERLVRPSVRVIVSDFEFDYTPTQIVDKLDGDGNPVISPRTHRPTQMRVQNNYQDLLSALCHDKVRNSIIALEIIAEYAAGHHVVVVSKRKDHLKALSEAISALDSSIHPTLLVGGGKGSEAREVARDIAESKKGTILLSTIAEEGLDIPKLDRCFLVYPARNPETVKQIIGRVMRLAEGKTDAIIYDVWDRRVGLLSDQYRGRRQQLYNVAGYNVEVRDPVLA